ncbi:MAG: hypothetical protein WBM61_09150, partial [Woeseiaceae bacterium]
DQLVARVDLKSDRQNRVLLVQSAHPETDASEEATVQALAQELHALADWLNLEAIKVMGRNRLCRSLTEALTAY